MINVSMMMMMNSETVNVNGWKNSSKRGILFEVELEGEIDNTIGLAIEGTDLIINETSNSIIKIMWLNEILQGNPDFAYGSVTSDCEEASSFGAKIEMKEETVIVKII